MSGITIPAARLQENIMEVRYPKPTTKIISNIYSMILSGLSSSPPRISFYLTHTCRALLNYVPKKWATT
jgi:hypothetical protein